MAADQVDHADSQPWRVKSGTVTDIAGILHPLVAGLSPARAHIAIDQIRGAQQSGNDERIVVLTVDAREPRLGGRPGPIAAFVGIQQSDPRDGDPSDDRLAGAATVVHAGWLQNPLTDRLPASIESLLDSMRRVCDREWRRRGVGFVQWAVDDPCPGPSKLWCEGLGFSEIGTLQYLRGPVGGTETERLPGTERPHSDAALAIDSADDNPSGLRFLPLRTLGDEGVEQFEQTVERTYEQTLDCPRLASFRTAGDALASYRLAPAYRPDLWFSLHDEVGDPVGCLILGVHESPETSSEPAQVAIELIYMGTVPQARGRKLGRRLIQKALLEAQRLGAAQLILAVDRSNHPAQRIYREAGLEPILTEAVWVKRVD